MSGTGGRASAPSSAGVESDALEDVVLRKLGETLLAVPVMVLAYVVLLARSGTRARAAAALGAGAVVTLVVLVAFSSVQPAPSAAIPPASLTPVAAELLDQVRTGHSLTEPLTVGFDSAMDPASVVAALRLSPDAATSFSWDAGTTTLTISPVGHWSPDTLYTLTIDASARAAGGAPLAAPVRAVVLTAAAGTGQIIATRMIGVLARIDTAFRIHLDRPVSTAVAQAALQTIPSVDGTVTTDAASGDLVFTPASSLLPDTAYHVTLDGLTDAEGVAFAVAPTLDIRTIKAPGVVRFRPRNGTTGADRAATVSVRFSEPMNHATTAAAFTVTVAGKAVAGKVTWAEQDTVLVFTPTAALPYGAKATMTIGATASSRAGVALGAAVSGGFTVQPKPVVKKTIAATTSQTTPIVHSGGSGAVSGSWYAVEVYYLKLMNCTRTGGWVTSTGTCSSPGGRNVAPLMLSAPISDTVTRPYARYLAIHGLCNHFYDGTPGDRLRRAGFTSYRWGENIGCEGGNPYSAVLGDHLFFQSEKPYNGGHYVNLMNALYDRAGIGVWVASGRVRLVIDFYHP